MMTKAEYLLEKLAAPSLPGKPAEKPKVPAKPAKKVEPTLKDKKELTVKELQKKYPKTYKTPSDAVLGRVSATPEWNKLYKTYLQQAAPFNTAAVQANPLSSAAKNNVIAVHNLLNSKEFLSLPEDVRQEILDDAWGGEGADLTRGGTSYSDLQEAFQNAMSNQGANMGGGEQAAQQMYASQYSPAGTQDPRFGQQAAQDIAKIKSDREQLNQAEKDRAYRYTNRGAGEHSQAFDNPADQKVYQDSVNNLRKAMRALGPVVGGGTPNNAMGGGYIPGNDFGDDVGIDELAPPPSVKKITNDPQGGKRGKAVRKMQQNLQSGGYIPGNDFGDHVGIDEI